MTTMKKIIFFAAAVLVCGLLAWKGKDWLNLAPATPKVNSFNPAFASYISAHSSGQISRVSPIIVRFTNAYLSEDQRNKVLGGDLLSFKPFIKGKIKWADAQTLTFHPDDPLPSGQIYSAKLDMKALVEDIPNDLQNFAFQFMTLPQDYEVEVQKNKLYTSGDQEFQQVQGVVKTLDYEYPEYIEKVFATKIEEGKARLRWEHDEKNNLHSFIIDSLLRKDKPYRFSFAWKSRDENKGEKEILVAAKSIFRHLHTYAYAEPEPFVVLEFTEELNPSQDLTGLITIPETEVNFSIEENRIKVYPRNRIEGQSRIKVESGIKSISGTLLSSPYMEAITFSNVKPEVKLVGQGVILPRGKQLPFIFEAIGLNAVDVRVIKIFERNIPQFFQANTINQNRELKRVGHVVAEKTIELVGEESFDINQWNRHSLDLSSLIEEEPGAIYEVALGFRQSYTTYTCGTSDEDVDMLDVGDDWREYTDSYQSNYYYYSYRERDNPCNRAYYRPNRIARRNILASDLGLIAKRSAKSMDFVATNLHLARPEADVDIELYDYQHELLASLKTDKDGKASLPKYDISPFLLVAKKGDQRGYLRLDDGSALSLSQFDTRGKTYFKGVKGYMYGERGVWRPGDPMFISFMLEDKEKVLPPEHPVSFELVDPKGKVVDKITQQNGLDGFYAFETSTDKESLTGNYTGRVRVGGATFTQTLKVETIMPNRLKIDLDFGTDRLDPSSLGKTGTLKSRWLHGAIAKNLKADVQVTLSSTQTNFDRYPDYNFDDQVGNFGRFQKTLFEGRLDDNGFAQVPTKIKVNKVAPGRLNANFKVKVFEPGGAFSVDRFAISYDPFETYVGIKAPESRNRRKMLSTDESHTFQIATVNPNGEPVDTDLDVRVYKLNWKWWWDRSNENIGIYNGKVNAEEIKAETLSTREGKTSYEIKLTYPSWGRYLVRVKDKKGGHASSQIVYIDWPGWAGRSSDDRREGAQMLSFTSEKETYKVGEDITLNISSSATARMLVSIETGSKVLDSYWVEGEEGSTRFTFKATDEMAPNIYANITLLQPHQQTKNDLPIRLFGVIPIKVENPESHLSPQIAMAKEIRPNTDFEVKVSEASGKPMTYTVAVVDEGLLGITRFETPDPWNSFYQREALNVKTWDLFDQVIGAYGGEVKSMLSIGGGAGVNRADANKQDRFRPVVKFIGPFKLKAGESATHSLHMPNYVGEVRTMVVAGNPEGAYGSAETYTPVRQPLMVLGTLPRVLGPGERVLLPATVFSMKENIKDVSIKIDGGSKILINGSSSQTLRFDGMGEKTTAFEADVLKSTGKSHVTFTVRSGRETAVYETDIEIRNPNPRITDVFSATVSSKDKWSQEYRPLGMSGTNNGVFEVSSIPPLNLGLRLKYLIRYPYGCVEQTTSGVFPQLMLSDLMDLSEEQKREVSENVNAGIKRLLHFQVPNGGLAYWPGYGQPNEWGTNYAGHALILAKQKGYSLPNKLLDNIIGFQKDMARGYDHPNSDSNRPWYIRYRANTQAYRLFMLALAGTPEIGAMNRFRKEENLGNSASWLLAGAYHLAGKKDIAKRMVKNLSMEVPGYQELSYTYGSTMRDKAIILQVMSILDQREEAVDIAQYLSDRMCNDRWYSTQTTAYTLVGMAEYAGRAKVFQKGKFQYRLDKKDEWKTVTLNSPIWQVDMDNLRPGELEFKNQSGTPLYPRMVLDGIPFEGDKTNAENGIRINVEYKTLNGQKIDPLKIEQGTDFMAKVILTNTGNRDYKEMVLNQVFPSGWEIHNRRLDGEGPKGDKPTYLDIRDDRVYTFFDLDRGKTKTFYVMLNASYLGKYWHPSVTSQAMYDHTINGRVGGAWVEVVEPGQGG